MTDGLQTVPSVSVIVPVHKGMDSIGGCLACLGRQSYSDARHEVIVVDNGGNPGIEALVAQMPGVTLVREPQPGSYAARNTGVHHARGEILAFTDADCLPARDWLSAGVAVLDSQPDVDLVGGRISLRYRRSRPTTLAERYEALTAFPQQRYVEDLHFGATANLFVRRHVFDAVKGFDGVLHSGGDRDFGQRATTAGYRIVYERGAVVGHPARGQMRELLGKAQRVARGEMSLWAKGGIRHGWRGWFNLLVPPLLWSWRVLRDRTKPWRFADRLVLILVQHIMYLSVLPVRVGTILKGRRGAAPKDTGNMEGGGR